MPLSKTNRSHQQTQKNKSHVTPAKNSVKSSVSSITSIGSKKVSSNKLGVRGLNTATHKKANNGIYETSQYINLKNKLIRAQDLKTFINASLPYMDFQESSVLRLFPHTKPSSNRSSYQIIQQSLGSAMKKDGSFIVHFCCLMEKEYPKKVQEIHKHFYETYKHKVEHLKSPFEKYFKDLRMADLANERQPFRSFSKTDSKDVKMKVSSQSLKKQQNETAKARLKNNNMNSLSLGKHSSKSSRCLNKQELTKYSKMNASIKQSHFQQKSAVALKSKTTMKSSRISDKDFDLRQTQTLTRNSVSKQKSSGIPSSDADQNSQENIRMRVSFVQQTIGELEEKVFSQSKSIKQLKTLPDIIISEEKNSLNFGKIVNSKDMQSCQAVSGRQSSKGVPQNQLQKPKETAPQTKKQTKPKLANSSSSFKQAIKQKQKNPELNKTNKSNKAFDLKNPEKLRQSQNHPQGRIQPIKPSQIHFQSSGFRKIDTTVLKFLQKQQCEIIDHYEGLQTCCLESYLTLDRDPNFYKNLGTYKGYEVEQLLAIQKGRFSQMRPAIYMMKQEVFSEIQRENLKIDKEQQLLQLQMPTTNPKVFVLRDVS